MPRNAEFNEVLGQQTQVRSNLKQLIKFYAKIMPFLFHLWGWNFV